MAVKFSGSISIPKEDKTLDAKAPETGEKSSIMDRLKSAKAVKAAREKRQKSSECLN